MVLNPLERKGAGKIKSPIYKRNRISISGVKIKCAGKVVELFPLKLERLGRIKKCVKYSGKWTTPIEFDNVAGSHARKWRQSIKCNGKELGDWLFDHGLEPQDTSQNQN